VAQRDHDPETGYAGWLLLNPQSKADIIAALETAARALDITADWHVPQAQAHPPKHWELPACGEPTEDGWCSTRSLAVFLQGMADQLKEK